MILGYSRSGCKRDLRGGRAGELESRAWFEARGNWVENTARYGLYKVYLGRKC